MISTQLIILISVVTVLIIIGATQRKQLVNWFRSESKHFIDGNTNNVKVANLKISDLKKDVKAAAIKAGKLRAHELMQMASISKLDEDIKEYLTKAKEAKNNDNKSGAINFLKLKEEAERQKVIIEDNISVIGAKRLVLEANIAKIKSYIFRNKIRLTGIEARKSTNDLLKSIHIAAIDNDTLEETIESAETKVTFEEHEVGYALDNEDPIDDTITEDLEDKFKAL